MSRGCKMPLKSQWKILSKLVRYILALIWLSVSFFWLSTFAEYRYLKAPYNVDCFVCFRKNIWCHKYGVFFWLFLFWIWRLKICPIFPRLNSRKSVFSRSSINEHKHTKLSILLFIFFELIILKDMIKDDIMNEYRQN